MREGQGRPRRRRRPARGGARGGRPTRWRSGSTPTAPGRRPRRRSPTCARSRPSGIELGEEPVHGVEALRALRGAVAVPLAMDETGRRAGRGRLGRGRRGVPEDRPLRRHLGAAARRRGGARSGHGSTSPRRFDGPPGIAAGVHAAAGLRLGAGRRLRPGHARRLSRARGPAPARDGEIAVPTGPGPARLIARGARDRAAPAVAGGGGLARAGRAGQRRGSGFRPAAVPAGADGGVRAARRAPAGVLRSGRSRARPRLRAGAAGAGRACGGVPRGLASGSTK